MRLRLLSWPAVLTTLSTLGACASPEKVGPQETTINAATLMPALRTSAHDSDLTELSQAIGLLSGSGVERLPSSAFKDTPRLALSRGPLPPASGALPTGNMQERLEPSEPVVFELMTDGESCYLYSIRTEQTVPLSNISCTAKAKRANSAAE
ncbi:MAG TPA: hypothetical protein VIC26_05190 [Marinagarivorans sp.]